MASVKVKYRPSSVEDHDGVIYYRIIHERKVRQLHTEYHVRSDEWNESSSMVISKPSGERKPLILSIRERIRWDVERLIEITKKLDNGGLPYTADDVIEEFKRYANEYSLCNYMKSAIVRLNKNGKNGTADNYRSALNSFKKFLLSRSSKNYDYNDGDIMLDNFTSKLIEDYEAWLMGMGVSPNTSSFYLRILRAVYNRAVEEDIVVNKHPFKRVYTGVERTAKRAISIEVIKRLKLLDLSLLPVQSYARDMFMMSFMLRGMSFIDMAYLRKSDLKNGCITYRRRKTGQKLTIEWTKEMQAILDNFETSATAEYLLPIIRNSEINPRSCYKNALRCINRNLKKIAETIGLAIPLTMYVARHSWASAAKTKGIPVSVISEGMGHDSETTTKIYLASLETSVVDAANSLILKALK